MGNNSFGSIYKITSFGESHGQLIGVIIDGVPPGVPLDINFIKSELRRRRPGYSNLSSSRKETDNFQIISGIMNLTTTGAPIAFIVKNEDVDSSHYEQFKTIIRPSHVDYPAHIKYKGFSDYRGSGRFSGRVTIGYVIAGAIAKQILKEHNIDVFAYTVNIGDVIDEDHYTFENLNDLLEIRDRNPVQALNLEKSKKMVQIIEEVSKDNDSIGGTIKCLILNVPPGLGNPVFNSLESRLSKAIFSIPSIKGIEFGVGFKAAKMRGTEHNDPWIIKDKKIITAKNDAGGIIGGLSTGMPIVFSVVVKPTASIGKPQKTVDMKSMEEVEIRLEGRHDPCIVPRAVVIVESMAAIVILDEMMKSRMHYKKNNRRGQ